MTTIGIIGMQDSILHTLKNLYMQDEEKQARLICIDSPNSNQENFDLLIINNNGLLAKEYLSSLNKNGMLVINTDDKSICKHITYVKNTPITYGFSSKACVTASSITDGEYKTVQCCIQRNIPTLTGNEIIEQEFSIKLRNDHRDIYSVLGAITAVLADNMPVEKISTAYNI